MKGEGNGVKVARGKRRREAGGGAREKTGGEGKRGRNW